MSIVGVTFLAVGLVVTTVLASALSHNAILDADNNYHLAWDFDKENITFEVSVKTRGYIGLGFSPNGGMAGSDIVIGWVDDSTGKGQVYDYHALGRYAPTLDQRQDYFLLNSSQNSSHTVLHFRRKLDLSGEEDRDIKDETARVIWAYHDEDPISSDSMQYHLTKRGNKNMFLLNPQRVIPKIPDNVIHVDFLNPNVTIPTHHTTYWCQSFRVPRLDRKHHVIKLEPVIQPGHESELHHILFYACYHPVKNESFDKGHECYTQNMPEDFDDCTSTILAWAIGGGPLYLPEHVGLPFGYEGDPTMFVMETHYDNPTLKEGLVDASGLRITLTPELREHDAGVLEIGERVSPTQLIPPFSDSFRTSGHCYPECLSQAMANQPMGIKAFGANLHSHLLGHAMRIRHFRNSMEMPVLSQDNNYDFNYQDYRLLQEEVPILPGDNLIMECDYRSTDRTGVTTGGLATTKEMCLGFILYYPKIRLANCQSTPTWQYLATFINVTIAPNTMIISPEKYAGKYLYQVLYDEVDWSSKATRDRYQKHIQKEGVAGFYVKCHDGDFDYPVHNAVMKLPMMSKPNCTQAQPCSGMRTSATSLYLLLIIFAALLA